MRSWSRLLLLFVCVGFAACSPLSPREAPRPSAVYTLDEIGAVTHTDKPLCRALSVSAVRSAPGYGSARMVYTRSPHKIEYFAYHKWADSPAAMLYPLLISGLEKSGRFGMVLPSNAREEGSLRLDSELIMLRQRFNGSGSQIELSVRTRLFANEQILATRVFQIEEDAGSGPESGVEAANRATGRWVAEVIGWMDEVRPKSQPSCGEEMFTCSW